MVIQASAAAVEIVTANPTSRLDSFPELGFREWLNLAASTSRSRRSTSACSSPADPSSPGGGSEPSNDSASRARCSGKASTAFSSSLIADTPTGYDSALPLQAALLQHSGVAL